MHIHAPISFYNSLFWVRKWVQHLWPQKDSPFCQERFFYQAFIGSLIRKSISGICPSKLCLFFSSSQKMFSFFLKFFVCVLLAEPNANWRICRNETDSTESARKCNTFEESMNFHRNQLILFPKKLKCFQN